MNRHSLPCWAQLFEGRLALNPGFSFLCSKAFSRINLLVTAFLKINGMKSDKGTRNTFSLENLSFHIIVE